MMSSISAADRSNQTDEIRRIREDYENKESESTKKKNKELREMNERQDKELAKIKAAYDDQITTMKSKQSETLDERDRRHFEDVNRIRELYSESLRRKSVDGAQERESMKSTFDEDLKKQKDISEQQKSLLEKNMVGAINEKNKIITDTQKRTSEMLKAGIEGNADRLNKKHSEEIKAIVGDRDRVVAETGKLVADIKNNDRVELDNEKRNHRLEVDRNHLNFETTVRDEHAQAEAMLNSKEEMLQDQVAHLNHVYQNRIEDETGKIQKMRDQFADEYESRTGMQIKKAQSDLSRVKSQQAIDLIGNKKSSELEKKHIIEAYQDRENALQKEKGEIFESVNEVAHERISKTNRDAEKLLADTNRRNKMDQQVSDMRYREAFAENETVLKDRVSQSQNKAEERVQKVMRVTNLAQKNQMKLHEDGLNTLKTKHSEDLQNQREAQLEAMKDMYGRMDNRIKSTEQRLFKKHEDAVDFYENKIDALQAQNKDETLRLVKTFEDRNKQREKAVAQEEAMITSKFEQRMAMQEDAHKKELDRLERRHQEQMQAVVSRVNAAQKKV